MCFLPKSGLTKELILDSEMVSSSIKMTAGSWREAATSLVMPASAEGCLMVIYLHSAANQTVVIYLHSAAPHTNVMHLQSRAPSMIVMIGSVVQHMLNKQSGISVMQPRSPGQNTHGNIELDLIVSGP
jgi:hypothetical protein